MCDDIIHRLFACDDARTHANAPHTDADAASADATMLWFAALDGACADHARAKLCELAGRLQHYCVNHWGQYLTLNQKMHH